MRIVCPACAATYEVPGGRLLPGRIVRCARCETDWAPVDAEKVAEPALIAAPVAPAPEPEPAHEAVEEVVPEPAVSMPMASAADQSTNRSGTRYVGALRVAWALSVLALLAAGWFAYSARERIMQAWPPSVRAYAALGLAGRH